MSQLASVVLAAASLQTALQADLSETARSKVLSPYFSPSPGEMLEIGAEDLRRRDPTQHVGQIRGHIVVSPPKGECLFIRRRPADMAKKVCAPTPVAFYLQDIDRPGNIVWEVLLGDGDFGTNLTWKTPYRKILVVRSPNPPDSTREVKYAKSCLVTANNSYRRALTVELFGGEKWVFSFPKEDRLLPQPPPLANLPIVWDSGKRNIADASRTAAFKSGSGAASVSSDGIDKNYDEGEDRKVWHIPRRHAYGMEASHFQPAGSVAPGVEGKCRYVFDGSEEDPGTGRVECRNGDVYSFVYAPIICMQSLGAKPRR